MEISEREYLELKEQVALLQQKVYGIDRKNDFINSLPEKVISHVRCIDNRHPCFEYSDTPGEVWSLFVQIAKKLHTKSDCFLMGTAYDGKPYIRSMGKRSYPKRITEMTDEEYDLSIQMLNEIIPIYNKYFRKTHEYVLYSDNDMGIFHKVYVAREE